MRSKSLKERRLGGLRVRVRRRLDGTLAGQYYRDNEWSAAIDADADETEDELFERLRATALQADRSFVGFDGAMRRFLAIFPGGFQDPAYHEEERGYKVDARELLNRTVPITQATRGVGYAEAVIGVFSATNLVHPVWEIPRMADALRSGDGDHLVQHLAKFALGDRSQLSAVSRIAHRHGAAKWPIVTYLPFLWATDQRNVILRHKPSATFAAAVGHEFPHVYESALLPAVYESLLDLIGRTEHEIAALNPRDLIDVQSFIWVVSKYGDKR